MEADLVPKRVKAGVEPTLICSKEEIVKDIMARKKNIPLGISSVVSSNIKLPPTLIVQAHKHIRKEAHLPNEYP